MKETSHKYPWLPVALLVTGMVASYVTVTTMNSSAEAAGRECPTTAQAHK